MSRRITKSWEEQDAYTGWRRVLNWHPGERKAIKRRTHQRERREAHVAALSDLPGPEPFEPLLDPAVCRHGCNGDCENTGSTRCDFTCHGGEDDEPVSPG
jgi:hypothetical protein